MLFLILKIQNDKVKLAQWKWTIDGLIYLIHHNLQSVITICPFTAERGTIPSVMSWTGFVRSSHVSINSHSGNLFQATSMIEIRKSSK